LYSELEGKVAKQLFEIGAIKFGEFRLKLHDRNPSAPLSPFYLNFRLIRSSPAVMDSVTDLFIELLKPLHFNLLADVPTAAGPIVAVLSFKTKIPMVSPRLGKKEHGTGASVDGLYKKGDIALVVDDLVTHAESKVEAIAILENEGLIVKDVVVIVDREQGGTEQLRKSGYQLHTIFRLNELLRFYREHGLLAPDSFDKCTAYIRSSQL
jgi:uridine monophosphate synthetase